MMRACPRGSEPDKLQFQVSVSSLTAQFQPFFLAMVCGGSTGTDLLSSRFTGAGFSLITFTGFGLAGTCGFSETSPLLGALPEIQTHSLLSAVFSQFQASSLAQEKVEYNKETKSSEKRQSIW